MTLAEVLARVRGGEAPTPVADQQIQPAPLPKVQVVQSVPPPSPLKSEKRLFSESEQRWYCEQIVKIGGQALEWCVNRAESYEKGPGKAWTRMEQESMASMDWIQWKKAQKK